VVAITISGVVTSEVRTSTNSSGVEKAQFQVESSESVGALPMRFEIVAFGSNAERAATVLKPGRWIDLFGRMSVFGDSRRVTVALSAFETPEGSHATA
jgi:hypothetical protein